MNKFPGVGDRIRQQLQTRGYWTRGRADVARFCQEQGYRPQYVYAWLKDRIPGYENLRRLSKDLGVSMAWLILGDDGMARPSERRPAELRAEERRRPRSHREAR